LGVLATTGPGPINFIDIHPRVEGTLPHDVTASFDWIFQWRESLEDGVDAVPVFLIRAADESRARFVGNSLQALATNEGQRRKKKLWSEQGRAQLEKLPLAPWASRRRKDHYLSDLAPP